MKDIVKQLMGFIDSKEFNECWNDMIKNQVLSSELSFKQICSLFFGFGVLDCIKKYELEKQKNGN